MTRSGVPGLDGGGVGFRSLTESIDTTTAGGRLLLHVFGSLAAGHDNGKDRDRPPATGRGAHDHRDRRHPRRRPDHGVPPSGPGPGGVESDTEPVITGSPQPGGQGGVVAGEGRNLAVAGLQSAGSRCPSKPPGGWAPGPRDHGLRVAAAQDRALNPSAVDRVITGSAGHCRSCLRDAYAHDAGALGPDGGVAAVITRSPGQPVAGAGMMSRPSWCCLCAAWASSLTVISTYGLVADPVA